MAEEGKNVNSSFDDQAASESCGAGEEDSVVFCLLSYAFSFDQAPKARIGVSAFSSSSTSAKLHDFSQLKVWPVRH